MSGQLVNFNKSAPCIIKGASKKCYNSLISIIGVRKMLEDERYLGNPLLLKKIRGATFDSLMNQIKSKIASCKAPPFPSREQCID